MKLCGFDIGLDQPFFLIAGPCVVESEQLQMDTAGTLKEITSSLGIPFIFKSSFDKANRSSGTSFRGPGMEKGLEILAKVKRELGLPVLTDVHTEEEIAEVAKVVDVLQTPAFLCRQTDFIRAVAQSGKPVNIKKGQFLAPHDMKNVIDKARAAAQGSRPAEDSFMACERGASFGYNNLVSRHALAGDHARDRRAGGVRRHPLGAAAGRPGHQLGRPARDGAGAGARGHGGRRGRPVHGNAPRPGQGLERRPQRRAAQAHEGAARNAAGARPHHQEERLPGEQLQLSAYILANVDVNHRPEQPTSSTWRQEVRPRHEGARRRGVRARRQDSKCWKATGAPHAWCC
jgi:hypothetical protein